MDDACSSDNDAKMDLFGSDDPRDPVRHIDVVRVHGTRSHFVNDADDDAWKNVTRRKGDGRLHPLVPS